MRLALVLFSCLFAVSCGSNEAVEFYPASGSTFRDSKPHAWEGISPQNYPVHGIDVSWYQGDIDWQRARSSGVSFAFIKATEGGDFLDPMFRENWVEAKRAGVKRGAYHFFYFCRSALEQAAWFVENVPRDPSSLPPVLDAEWNHTSKTCRHRPDADIVRKEMSVFARILTDRYGKKPIIYSTVDFYQHNELYRLNGYQFWLRSVAGHPSTTYPNQNWLFWQYTGTGRVPGISGNADINVFYGSKAHWNNWAGG